MGHKTSLLLLGILLTPSILANVLVHLPNGKIRGRDDGDFYSYEGIPYAEPPLGDLRFELPQPYTREWKTVFDATKAPVACIQRIQFIDFPEPVSGSEDCLTVSVYKPKDAVLSRLPVIVDIHGGAFMFGSSIIDGHQPLMATRKFIVAKINYRLGPIGFISTGDKVLPGNNGLKDQRLALQWIKKNIDRFGGDPENILLIGHSAGGASTHLQILHKDFGQLAKVAVSVSGNALDPWVVQPGARRRAFELGRIVGCGLLNDSRQLKECLKKKDANDMMLALRDFLVLDFIPCTPFGPVVEPEDAEDPFITQHPTEIIKGGQSPIPWLTSYLKEDGGFNAAVLRKKMANGEEQLGEANRLWYDLAPLFFFYRHKNLTDAEMDDMSAYLRQSYLNNERLSIDNYFTVQDMFTDIVFKNGAVDSLYLHAHYGESPVFGYTYDNPANRGYGQLISGREDLQFGKRF